MFLTIFLYITMYSLWGPFHVVAFNTIVLLLTMSHLKAVCSDPGVVPLPQSRMDFSDIHTDNSETKIECDERDNWTVCTRCETYRPPKAHHCRICKRCIRRMDHHCPWYAISYTVIKSFFSSLMFKQIKLILTNNYRHSYDFINNLFLFL